MLSLQSLLICIVAPALVHFFCTYTDGRPLSGTMVNENSSNTKRTSNKTDGRVPTNRALGVVDNTNKTLCIQHVVYDGTNETIKELLNKASLEFSNPQINDMIRIKNNKWELAKFVLIRTVPATTDQLLFFQSLLQKGSNVWIQFWRPPDAINRHTDFWITPKHFNKYVSKLLCLLNIHFEIINKDLLKEGYSSPITMDNIGNFNEVYHSLDELNSEMIRLVTVYDSIMHAEVIGKSYEGRPIYVIHLRSDRSTKKPILFILCGNHPREWLAVSSCQYTLRRLVFDRKYDKDISKLLEHYDVAMVPMLNPDGYVYTWEKGRLWRKTRSKGYGRVCRGVDLNRNFNYRWGVGGMSTNPCEATYSGRRPFSESESLALGKYVYHMRRNIAGFLDVHTYGEMFMSPWGFSKKFPRDYERQEAAMKKIHEAIKQETGQHYSYGRSFVTLYQTSGTSIDWVYGMLSITHTYGVELRPNFGTRYSPFVRSPKEIIPSGKDLLTGLKALALHMMQENKHAPKDYESYFAEKLLSPPKQY